MGQYQSGRKSLFSLQHCTILHGHCRRLSPPHVLGSCPPIVYKTCSSLPSLVTRDAPDAVWRVFRGSLAHFEASALRVCPRFSRSYLCFVVRSFDWLLCRSIVVRSTFLTIFQSNNIFDESSLLVKSCRLLQRRRLHSHLQPCLFWSRHLRRSHQMYHLCKVLPVRGKGRKV